MRFSFFIILIFVTTSYAGQTCSSPWLLTRQQWVQAGGPDCEIASLCRKSQKENILWQRSSEDEIQAINGFAALFADPVAAYQKGVLNSGENKDLLEADRDPAFADHLNSGALAWCPQSSIPGTENRLEDARISIIIGRKLGYREKDILWYVVRNFIMNPFAKSEYKSRLKKKPNASLVDKSERAIWEGMPVPENAKNTFPFLKATTNFF